MLSQADRAIGRLDGICSTLPNSQLFLSMYVREEAVLSSQIEGTQSSLTDLLLFENAHHETREDSAEKTASMSHRAARSGHGAEPVRAARFAAHAHLAMQKVPVFSISRLAQEAGPRYATAERAVRGLIKLGIAAPLELPLPPKLFVYSRYMDILSEGTEPLPR